MKKVLFSVHAWQWYPNSEDPDGGQYDLVTEMSTEDPTKAFEYFKRTDVDADKTELRLEVDNGDETIIIAFKCAVTDEECGYILWDGDNNDIDYDGIAKILLAIPKR